MNPLYRAPDDQAETKPTRPAPSLEAFQPIRIFPKTAQPNTTAQQRPARPRRAVLWAFVILLLFYFCAPLRTNVLILGVDGGLGRGEVGRTDTIILTTISPLRPYVGMLAIPRDLWVTIPEVGENRINTAYFFAESQALGSGPAALARTIRENFGVGASYSIVLRMDGLIDVVEAMGGLNVTLDRPMSGYEAGSYHFDGAEALAFVRSRAGSDDFARMIQGQILLRSALRASFDPSVWLRAPQILSALNRAVDINIPAWQWPRLGFALLRASLVGVDARTIRRDMVNPFITSQGAQVLAPDWEAIKPLVDEMFH